MGKASPGAIFFEQLNQPVKGVGRSQKRQQMRQQSSVCDECCRIIVNDRDKSRRIRDGFVWTVFYAG